MRHEALSWLFAASCLLGSVGAQAQSGERTKTDSLEVSNDSYTVKVLRAEMAGTLYDGMILPPSTDKAFLVVHLETDDPCFDPANEQTCFLWAAIPHQQRCFPSKPRDFKVPSASYGRGLGPLHGRARVARDGQVRSDLRPEWLGVPNQRMAQR